MADLNNAKRDGNYITSMLLEGTDGLTYNAQIDEVTGRLLVDMAGGGSGTVTDVSVVTANGFAGTVATSTTTPAITLSTTLTTPVIAGNGTALIAATTTGSGSTVVLSASPTITGVLTVPNVTAPNTLVLGVPSGNQIQLVVNNTVIAGVINTGFYPASDDSFALGSASFRWSDFRANTATFSGAVTLSGLTASEIVITDASKNLVSASVATYPSLTELAYVKGVTSAIQTQLNAKGVGTVTSVAQTVPTGLTISGSPVTTTGTLAIALDTGYVIPLQSTIDGKANTALSNLASVAINTTLVSDTDNTDALGTTAIAWSDLFLGSGGVITFNSAPSTPDITITHSADTLTFAGGTIVLGVASATTYNGLAITANGTNTLAIAAGKTLTASNSITLAGTDSTVMTFPTTSATIARTDAGQTFTGTQTLAENASIALDPAGSADGKYTGITIAGTAGATLAFGDLVYLAAADSRWELADADAATTSDRMMGMCVLAATGDGDPTVLLLMGQIRADAAFPALTIGSAVYVGETAGDIQVAIPTGADNVIRRVGYALTADEIYFNPSMDSQISVA